MIHSLRAGSDGVTFDDRSRTVMAWITESFGRSFARNVLARAQEDRLALFDTRGEFVAARDDSVTIDPLAIISDTRTSSRFVDFVEFPPRQYPAKCTSRISLPTKEPR